MGRAEGEEEATRKTLGAANAGTSPEFARESPEHPCWGGPSQAGGWPDVSRIGLLWLPPGTSPPFQFPHLPHLLESELPLPHILLPHKSGILGVFVAVGVN